MSDSYMNKAFFCILCTDTVALKEERFVAHMRVVHDVISHLNFLLRMNFIDKNVKASFVSKIKQGIKKSEREKQLTCLFCRSKSNAFMFSLNELIKFRAHLEETHAMFYELDLILVMHLLKKASKNEIKLLVLLDEAERQETNACDSNETKIDNTLQITKNEIKENQTGEGAENILEKNKSQFQRKIFKNENVPDEEEHDRKTINSRGKPQKPFKCKYCGRKFRYIARFKDHVLRKHEQRGLGCYKCDECPKAYTLRQSLVKHKFACHSEFKCDMCEFISVSKVGIHKHRKKHLNTIFNCKYCNEIFDAREKRRKHTNSRHSKKKYTPMTCLLCQLNYSNQDSYKVHVKKHHSHPEALKQEDTKLEDTKLDGSKLKYTKLEDAKLEDTKLEDKKFKDLKLDDK